jgi:hypothetical protein
MTVVHTADHDKSFNHKRHKGARSLIFVSLCFECQLLYTKTLKSHR